MNGQVIKFGGGLAVLAFATVAGNQFAAKEEAALTEQYGLSEAQVMVMRFCNSDLDRTDLTYDRDTSDRAICGCIADKVAVSAEFTPVLKAGFDRYTTHSGNRASTGPQVAEQLTAAISEGEVPARFRRDVSAFGSAYQAGERICLMSLD